MRNAQRIAVILRSTTPSANLTEPSMFPGLPPVRHDHRQPRRYWQQEIPPFTQARTLPAARASAQIGSPMVAQRVALFAPHGVYLR